MKLAEFVEEVIEKPEKFSLEDKIKFLKELEKIKIAPEDLANTIKFLKKKQTIKLSISDAIDICGTGGSGLDRINTSTLTAILLAKKYGKKIAKHGNKASSGRFGSFDLLEKLGWKIPTTKEEILNQLKTDNIVFLYAKVFYPFFKYFASARKEYAKPTVFNILGPLLNPANTNYQMIGCSFEEKIPLIVETLKILGKKKAIVVRGEDGLDEVTLTGKTLVYKLEDGKIEKFYIEPEDFGFKKVKLEEILEKDIDKKILIAKKIIAGENVGPYSDLVNLNVAVANYFFN